MDAEGKVGGPQGYHSLHRFIHSLIRSFIQSTETYEADACQGPGPRENNPPHPPHPLRLVAVTLDGTDIEHLHYRRMFHWPARLQKLTHKGEQSSGESTRPPALCGLQCAHQPKAGDKVKITGDAESRLRLVPASGGVLEGCPALSLLYYCKDLFTPIFLSRLRAPSQPRHSVWHVVSVQEMVAVIRTIIVTTIAMTGAEEDTQSTGWVSWAQGWVIFTSSGPWDRVQLE